jgi:protein O-mannosyl-transferase
MSENKKNKSENFKNQPKNTENQPPKLENQLKNELETGKKQPILTEKETDLTEKGAILPKKWLWGLLVLILAVVFGLYSSSFKNDFVDWDDYAYVVDNELVRNEKIANSVIWKKPISLNYHPLTIQTMRWNSNKCEKCAEGISARPFIQWNVIIHCANVALVFWLIYGLSGFWWIAAFCSLWFGIHPLHVESVAWVSERKDVLYVFFSLLSLLSFSKFLQTGEKNLIWWAATTILLVLACLSKAMAVVSPLLMMLILYWKLPLETVFLSLKGIFQPKRLLYFAPLLAISLLFGLMAVKIQSGDNFLGMLDVPKNTAVALNEFKTFNLLERFHFAAVGYSAYIVEFFLPMDLCTFYPYPSRVEYENSNLVNYARLFFMLGTLFFVFYALFTKNHKLTKIAAFGIGFYFVAVVLVLQFLSVGVVIKADRYSYFPHIGLIFMLLSFWAVWIEKNAIFKPLGLVLGLVASAFFAYKTHQQIAVWQNSETLWTQVINSQQGRNIEQPYSIRGHAYGKLADKAAKNNQMDKVKLYLDKAFNDFQACIKVGTNRGEVYEGLGNIYGMRQDYLKALENYNRAAELDSTKASIFYNRGVTYSILQQWDKAVENYNFSEELGNDKISELRQNRALSAINAKQFVLALKDLNVLCQEQPNNYAHFANRGVCKAQLADKNAAIADFQLALKLKPNDEFSTNQLNLLK